jgi:hypothetical protein
MKFKKKLYVGGKMQYWHYDLNPYNYGRPKCKIHVSNMEHS